MNWSCSELYSKTHDIIETVPIIYWSEQIWLEQNELTGKGTIVLKKKSLSIEFINFTGHICRTWKMSPTMFITKTSGITN